MTKKKILAVFLLVFSLVLFFVGVLRGHLILGVFSVFFGVFTLTVFVALPRWERSWEENSA